MGRLWNAKPIPPPINRPRQAMSIKDASVLRRPNRPRPIATSAIPARHIIEGSDLATQLSGKQRSDKTSQCDRDQCIRRMELTIAQRIREVEHSDQRCSLERDAEQEDGDVRTGKAPCLEQAEVHYWLALPYLNHNKEDHAPQCRTEERQNGHRGPTPLVSLDDRQHETNDHHCEAEQAHQ